MEPLLYMLAGAGLVMVGIVVGRRFSESGDAPAADPAPGVSTPPDFPTPTPSRAESPPDPARSAEERAPLAVTASTPVVAEAAAPSPPASPPLESVAESPVEPPAAPSSTSVDTPPTGVGPAELTEMIATGERLELIAAIRERPTRAAAMEALADDQNEQARAAVLEAIPQLTWDECHAVVETLRSSFRKGDGSVLIDVLLRVKRKGPKALLQDLLSLLRDPEVADRALSEEPVLGEIGASTFARSVRLEHAARLESLSRASHRFLRSMAVHGFAGLLAFEQLTDDQREGVQASLGRVASGDRSKPVRAQAAHALAASIETLREAYAPDLLTPLGDDRAAASEPEPAPVAPGSGERWEKVPPSPRLPINMQQYSVYSEHFLSALNPQDDDDRRVRETILGTIQTPGGILALKVTQEEIQQTDLRGWLAMVEFLGREGWLLAARGRLSFVLEGFLDDPRELWDIPEALAYMRRLWGPLPWLPVWIGPSPGWALQLLAAVDGLDGSGADAHLNQQGAAAILHAVNHAFALTHRLGDPNLRVGHDLLQLIGLQDEDPESLFTGVDVLAIAETMSSGGVVSSS